MENLIQKFKNEKIEYSINVQDFKKILKDFEEEINENESILNKANDIDYGINQKRINKAEIKKIINLYKKITNVSENYSKNIVMYKGDPYLTLHILIQALIKNKCILLMYDDFMVGVNEVIISAFKKVLKKHKIENMFFHNSKISVDTIKKLKNVEEQIIVIGDTSIYQVLEGNKKFCHYNNIMLYSDDEKFEELKETIYIYANENEYELEILYEDTAEDAIQLINANGFIDTIIVLTNNQKTKDIFNKEAKNKKIYINENPFKQENIKIYNYFK